jgi:hypothetical protein
MAIILKRLVMESVYAPYKHKSRVRQAWKFSCP